MLFDGCFSAPKREPLAPIGPQDRDSRARSIANTFQTAHLPLSELRHPTKQHLTATEVFDFLPDSELWAHEYDFVRFGEDPIDRGNVSSFPPLLSVNARSNGSS